MSGEGPLRVGLIGCGNIALRHHAPAHRALAGRSQVVAVADPSPERRRLAAAELSLAEDALFDDALRLLETVPLDVVDVCTPQHLRKEIVLAAVGRGCHVLSEKPLATAPADAAALVDAAAAAGVQLGVMHNYLFFPEIAAVAELVAAGEIGRPEVAIVNYLGVPDLPGTRDWRPDWRHDPTASGGGVLMDMLHVVYVAEALLASRFLGVSAFVTSRDPGSAVEDIALCRYEADGAAALVDVGWGQGPGGMHVSGREGRVEIRYAGGGTAPFAPLEGVWVHDADGPRPVAVAPPVDSVAVAVADFVDALLDGRAPRATGADGLRALEATVAAYASAATGRVVPLPLDRDDPVYRNGVAGLRELDRQPAGGRAR